MTSSAISRRSRRRIGTARPPHTVHRGIRHGLDEDARSRGVVGRVGAAARALGEGGQPLHRGNLAVHLEVAGHAVVGQRQPAQPEERAQVRHEGVGGRRRGRGLEDPGRGRQDRVLPVQRGAEQLGDLLHAHAGDPAHAAAHCLDRSGLVGQLHHELVDGHPGLALEHLQPDHVALGHPDLGSHRTEDPRSVGEPDPHPGQHPADPVDGPDSIEAEPINGSGSCARRPAWCSRRCRRRCP